jgi:hypothetical protein
MYLLSLLEWRNCRLFFHLLIVIKAARDCYFELELRRHYFNGLWNFYFSFDLECSRLRIWIPQLVSSDRFGFRHLRVAESRVSDEGRPLLVAYGLDVP